MENQIIVILALAIIGIILKFVKKIVGKILLIGLVVFTVLFILSDILNIIKI